MVRVRAFDDIPQALPQILQRRRSPGVLLTAAASAVVAALLAGSAVAYVMRPEWRSSGDGRTIFNSRTGELRFTQTGRSVSEIQAAARKEANSKIFWDVKSFVDSHPNLEGAFEKEWHHVTNPFRENKLLVRTEHDDLMAFFAHASEKNPRIPRENFTMIARRLNDWQFASSE